MDGHGGREPAPVVPEGGRNASNKRLSFSRVVPEAGKKRVNYGKGDARRIMEEAVSLCEAMTLGYEVVFHGRRRSSNRSTSDGIRCVYCCMLQYYHYCATVLLLSSLSDRRKQ